MNIEQLESYNLADAVKFNDQLNPRLWGADEHLLPEVREKLLAIADEFQEFLGVNDLQLKDITISGSNAAYTYTPHSDIDLHLVVDLPEADRNEVYRELFDAKKYVFNDMHDIKIGGYDVELYVQDANKTHHSQGIYSVVNNEWVDVPKRRRTKIDDVSTRSKYEDLAQRIDTAIASDSYKQMSSLTGKIRDMRQAGLDEHGEFGPENLAFKMLRTQGKIKQLHDARNAARDQELSLRERGRHKPVFRYGFGRPNMEDLDVDGVMMTRPSSMSSESVEENLDVDGVMMTRPTSCSNESAGDTESDESILTDFVDFCSKELKLEQLPTIKLRKDPQWPVVHKTFGRYINDKQLLEVAWGHRHIMDVLRTVAHELTHRHQHERDGDQMDNTAGETGSPWENEANARAGILMRDYARLHPDYFAQGQAHDLVEKKDPVDEGVKSNAAAAAIVAALAGSASAQSVQGILGTIRNTGTMVQQARGITRAGLNAEVQQEIQNYVRANGGNAGAQNLSQLYQLQRQLQQQEPAQNEPLPGYTQDPDPVQESASGYIPTKRQAKDPRFSMALTQDIRPGQLGKEANKLKLKTNRQGVPQIANPNGLFEKLALELSEFKKKKIFTVDDFKIDAFESIDTYRRWQQSPKTSSRGTTRYHANRYANVFVDVKLVESSDTFAQRKAEAAKFSQSFKNLDHREGVKIAVGNSISLLSSTVVPGDDTHDSRIELSGFVTPKRIVKINLDSNNKIDTLEFSDGSRFPEEAEFTTVGGANITNTILFSAAEQARRAYSQVWMMLSSMEGQGWKVEKHLSEPIKEKKLFALAEAEELDEVRMSPTALKKFAASPAAKGILVGFEAELIFPDVRIEDEDPEYEPDYEQDTRPSSIREVIEFFSNDEWGYGLSERQQERLRDNLDEAYMEWYDEQMIQDFKQEADDLIKKVMIDEKDWVQEDEVRKQLDMMDITGADQEAVLAAGSRAPTFKTSTEQQAYMEEHPEYEKYIEALGEAEELLDDLVQDSVRAQDKYWDAAIDDFRDYYSPSDDSGFFGDVGLRWMSDVSNRFDLGWPYMTSNNDGDGNIDIENVATSLEDVVQMPVTASGGYHQATRKPGVWIVEPDSSLRAANDEDGGLEIISPPMPIEQAMQKLQAVIDWAQKRGCYTNSSTGLHMGVSLPGQQSFAEAENDAEPAPVAEKPIDFVKLALFLGDQHVLKQFEREANNYCRSSLEKLKAKNWSPQQIATAMEKMRGNLINLAYKDLADRSPGRDSINMKDNYVEFRSAGGDYLSKESDQGMAFLENTLLRYVRALAIAGDPAAERQEYAKKLYKLISPEGDTTLDLFSKFATGEISSEQLKKNWAKRTLEKEKPTGDEREWEAYNPDTGEVLGTVKDFSITNATNYFRDKLNRFQIREKDPELTTSRAKLAKNIVAQGPGPKVYYKWDISNPKSGEASTDYMTRDRVFQTTRQIEKENPKTGKYTNTIVGGGSAQVTSNQEPRDISTMTFDFRAKGSAEVVEQKTFTKQEQDASPVVSAIERANELAKELGKPVTAYEVADTTAKPAQAKDYNYEIVNLGDVNLGVVDKFYATDKQDADATFDKWLEMKGLPNDTSNYGYRPRKQQPAPSTNPNPTASIANQARAVNGVPMWELFDVDTGSVVHAIADHTGREAYDQGMAWLRSIGAENPETYGERFAIRPKLETSSAQDAADLQRNTERGEWEFYRTETGNVIDRVNDADRMQANAVRADIVRRYGHPDDSVGMRRVEQDSFERNSDRIDAIRGRTPDATQQEGTWQLVDVTVNRPVETFQGTWAEADRIAQQYETGMMPSEHEGHEISVRRA